MVLTLRRALRTFIRDERGVSAVEFAFIAPVLIVLYFGMAELCQGLMAKKRMGHATAMVADLTAQEELVDTQALNDTFNIGGLIMKPFSAAPLAMRVTSVTKDANGRAMVDWSYGNGKSMTALRTNTVFPTAIPVDLIGNGESLVISEASYAYDSPVKQIVKGIATFRHTYYLRPRISAKTTCTNCPVVR